MRLLLLGILLTALGGVHGVIKDGGCPNDCSGNGYCIRGSCYCLPGFTSKDCSAEGCLNDCSEHGTCVNGVCQCTYGWVGHDCSARGCRNNCYNHGVCHISASSVNCRCFANYTGLECEHVVSTAFQHCEAQLSSTPFAVTTTGSAGALIAGVPSNAANAVCSGHGVCANNQCYCSLGYTGVDCSQKVCPKQCNGHGVCNTYTGVCMCFQGFSGLSCEQARCPLSCSGRGVCNTTSGVCMCYQGFFGDDCSPLNCEDQTCSGHGSCVKTKFMPVASCNCTNGWTGSKCDVRICGTGWTGPNCDIPKCDEDCSGHGLCVARAPGTYTTGMNPHQCQCFAGYTGVSCRTRTCVSRCENGGYCKDGECVCVNEWVGPTCTVPPKRCAANCTNHGECHWGDCYCEPGYYGLDCAILRRFTPPMVVTLNVMGCIPTCHSLHGVCVTLNVTVPIPLKLSLAAGTTTTTTPTTTTPPTTTTNSISTTTATSTTPTSSSSPKSLSSSRQQSLSPMPAPAPTPAFTADGSPPPTALLQTSSEIDASVSSLAALSLLREWYHQINTADGVQLRPNPLATATSPSSSSHTSDLSSHSSPSSASSSSSDTVLLQETASALVPHTPPAPEFFSMVSMPHSVADLFTSRLPPPEPLPLSTSPSPSPSSSTRTRHRPQSSSQSSSLEPAVEMASFAEVSARQQSEQKAQAEARQRAMEREAAEAALMDTVRHTKLEFTPTFATDIRNEPFLRLSALTVPASSVTSSGIRPGAAGSSLVDMYAHVDPLATPHITLSPGRFLNAILSQLSYISSPSTAQAQALENIQSLAAVDDMQLQSGTGIIHVCYCRDGFTGLTCSRRSTSSLSSSSATAFLDSATTGAPS